MLINQNVENAARIAMGPLSLEEPTAKVSSSVSSTVLRVASSVALAAAVVAAMIAIFS